MGRIRTHWKGLTAGAAVIVIAGAVGGPFLYIHVLEGSQPAALTLADVPSAPVTGAAATPVAGIDGTWTVGTGSDAGYRVPETLLGQKTTAVGRTTAVTGSMTVAGSDINAAGFTVQMAKVTSDRSQRDAQFAGRIMDTAAFPTGTFTLTSPIALGSVPAVGATVTPKVSGMLTLHGKTRPVTFTAQAKRTADQIDILGSITISYADYGIDNPSIGGFVSVGSGGTIEFLLVTSKT